MTTTEFIAIFGGVLAAFLLRFTNILADWLARVLKVDEPDSVAMPPPVFTHKHNGTSIDQTGPPDVP